MRLAVGEMADALLLSSIRVVPARLQDSGFRFEDTDLFLAVGKNIGESRAGPNDVADALGRFIGRERAAGALMHAG